MVGGFPKCRQCEDGELVPLSDFSNQGASLMYKAWACTNVACGYNLKIRSGEIVVNEPITYAAGRSALKDIPASNGIRRGNR